MNNKSITEQVLNSLNFEDEMRFWEKVDIKSSDECWVWTGAKSKKGYGIFGKRVNGKPIMLRATRVLSRFRGDKTEGLVAMHKCDNPSCCNPEHVVMATAKQNTQDMIGKNRDDRVKKIPDGQIHIVFSLSESGFTHQKIADFFGVSRPHITRILDGTYRSRVS